MSDQAQIDLLKAALHKVCAMVDPKHVAFVVANNALSESARLEILDAHERPIVIKPSFTKCESISSGSFEVDGYQFALKELTTDVLLAAQKELGWKIDVSSAEFEEFYKSLMKSMPQPPVNALPKVSIELPDGDDRELKLWWKEMRNGVLDLSISVGDKPSAYVSVKDELPPMPETPYMPYLCKVAHVDSKASTTMIVQFDRDAGRFGYIPWFDGKLEVTHWMPLPE